MTQTSDNIHNTALACLVKCEERVARGMREINVDTLVSTLTCRGRH